MKKANRFHHGDLRNALLTAAVDLLDSEGASGATLRAVAARAGVSHSAPANHFHDRRALLTEVARIEFTEIWNDIQAKLSASSPPDAGTCLSYFCETIVDYAITHPNRYDLLWRSDLIDHEAPTLLAVMDDTYDALCSLLKPDANEAPQDVHTKAVMFWSMTHGYAALRLSGMFQAAEDEITKEPRFTAMLNLMMDALGITADELNM